MEKVLLSAARKFESQEYIKSLKHGVWHDMYDEDGNLLEGIRGKMGCVIERENGEEFGIDCIEMQPGTKFPLHTHPGDHILYILHDSVDGGVVVDGVRHVVSPGDSIAIPGEYPHGVTTLEDAKGPLRFLAVGVPHKHVSATDRMTFASDDHSHKV